MLANKWLGHKRQFISRQTFRTYWICQRRYYTPAMQDFLQAPDHWLAQSTQFFKNTVGDTTTVGIIILDNIPLVVKRYNVKNVWHGLKLFFRPSRALTSWHNAQRLLALNIPTVEPVAVLEQRFGWLRRQAYFVSRYVAGISGSEYFARHCQSPVACAKAINTIVRILQQLKAAKIRHNDFHHSNFLMAGDQPLLLDLDHMRQYRCANRFAKVHQKDIVKFKHYLEVEGNTLALQLFDQALARAQHITEIT